MKKSLLTLSAIIGLCVTNATLAAEDGTAIPYNSVNKSMSFLKSQKVKGVDCVPWYVRHQKGAVLDPAKAKFRVRTWEGHEHVLEIEPLSKVPAEQLSEFEKELKAGGYTHRMWIPKGKKEFMDGDIVHSLPKGSIDMAQGMSISRKFGKDPKK